MALAAGQAEQYDRIMVAYPHEQAVLRRVLRRYGPLHERDFDRIFARGDLAKRANALGYFRLNGDSPMLGLSLGGPMGNWKQWLHLLQCMIAADEVDAQQSDSGVVYRLRGSHEH